MSLPLKLYGGFGPNPAKVQVVLEELDIKYETESVGFAELKGPEYTKINPNGRLPALVDPNTGIAIWESGAIIEYLIEQYDKSQTLSFERGSKEYYEAKQYLHFQMSGQGPYYGQAVWFAKSHPEQIESAQKRYFDEQKRVTGVIEEILSRQEAKHGNAGEGPWLVGEKYSYADISFVIWQQIYATLMGEASGYNVDEYPRVKAWMDRMTGRPKVAAALQAVFTGLAAQAQAQVQMKEAQKQ